MNVAQYLVKRLRSVGIEHVFGVPGDFNLPLTKLICETNDLKWIGTCGELGAAYAADGYARIKGAGALITTYGVGELSAINGIAGAFAERVPIVLINGAPTRRAFRESLPLHHTLGDYDLPRQMFERVTVANAFISDPAKACGEIDRVISAMFYFKRPVYISIPSDVWSLPCGCENLTAADWAEKQLPTTDPIALNEAVEVAAAMLARARNPVIIADVEVIRYHLQEQLKSLVDRSGIPIATMLMGKGAIDESHPQFIGLYMGNSSRDEVKLRIDDADCILEIGVFVSDLNTGGFSMQVSRRFCIAAQSDRVQIKSATYHNVFLGAFLESLTLKIERKDPNSLDIRPAKDHAYHRRSSPFQMQPEKPLVMDRFFDRIAHFLPENCIVVAETSNSLFGTADTNLPPKATYISQVFYNSLGFSLPAALGASLAAPGRPVMLFLGDGGFQMTCQEVSTMIRNMESTNIMIFLLNNFGYTIERVLIEGPYNDISNWDYSRFVQVVGATPSCGTRVRNEQELEEVLRCPTSGVTVVECQFDKMDCTRILQKACVGMRKSIDPNLKL